MPTSLEHGPKYKCRKINRGHHTLEMRKNGTQHDIPNTNHLREKGEEEGRGFKRVHNQMRKTRLLYLLNLKHLAHIYMLASSPFLLAPRRPCPSSENHRSVYVLARKIQETSRQAMAKETRRAYERGIKQMSMINIASKGTRKQTNKRESEQARKRTKGGVHEVQM